MKFQKMKLLIGLAAVVAMTCQASDLKGNLYGSSVIKARATER
jgi:hypothetical protein